MSVCLIDNNGVIMMLALRLVGGFESWGIIRALANRVYLTNVLACLVGLSVCFGEVHAADLL